MQRVSKQKNPPYSIKGFNEKVVRMRTVPISTSSNHKVYINLSQNVLIEYTIENGKKKAYLNSEKGESIRRTNAK